MPIYKRGGTFLVSVGSGQDRFRGTAKTRAEAEDLELEQTLARKRAAQGKAQAAPSGAVLSREVVPVVPQKVAVVAPAAATTAAAEKTLKDAFDRTMRLRWKGKPAEKTHTINSTSIIKMLGGGNVPLSHITATDIADAVLELEDLGNSGSTINKKVSCLHMMYTTAQDEGWVKEIPKMLRREENEHRVRWMDEAEEAKVLALVEHLGLYDLRDYIIVAIDTGFRRGELLHFRSKDFANGLLHLHAGSTKNGLARSVPATKRVTEILTRRADRAVVFQELDAHSLRWQWEKVRGLLGMNDDPQFVVHMLRHTCASRLVQRGVPLAVVQKWMGHKKIETTLRYAHLAPDSLLMGREALEQGRQWVPSTTPLGGPVGASADF